MMFLSTSYKHNKKIILNIFWTKLPKVNLKKYAKEILHTRSNNANPKKKLQNI